MYTAHIRTDERPAHGKLTMRSCALVSLIDGPYHALYLIIVGPLEVVESLDPAWGLTRLPHLEQPRRFGGQVRFHGGGCLGGRGRADDGGSGCGSDPREDVPYRLIVVLYGTRGIIKRLAWKYMGIYMTTLMA